MKTLTLLLPLVLSVIVMSNCATNKVFCYFGSWSTYRPGHGKFDVEDIDPTLCSHLIYAFIGLDASGSIVILDPYNEITNKALIRFRNLKTRNPKVKILAALGGYNQGSQNFSIVTRTPVLRTALINNIVSFINQYKMDGIDIDWEYPAENGGNSVDKNSFVDFLKQLKSSFTNTGYIITTAVAADAYFIPGSYNVSLINTYVDYINLMAYDFRTPEVGVAGVTGEHSGLYASAVDMPSDKNLNSNASVVAWIKAGASPNKIVLGIPMYGCTYTLANINKASLGAPTTGAGLPGPYSQQAGVLTHLEICEKINNGGWQINWISEQKVPYAVNKNQWIGYENVVSVKNKAQYAIANNLAGVMIWSIDMDDGKNYCSGCSFPLLKSINNVIKLP